MESRKFDITYTKKVAEMDEQYSLKSYEKPRPDFASNINLGLRNNKTVTELAFKDIKSNGNGRYNERSNIPNELIFDMIRKCERKLNESRII